MKYFENGSLRLSLKEAISANQKHENKDPEKNQPSKELNKKGISMPVFSMFKSITLKPSNVDDTSSQNTVSLSDFL